MLNISERQFFSPSVSRQACERFAILEECGLSHQSWPTYETGSALCVGTGRIHESSRMPADTGGDDSTTGFETQLGLAGMSENRGHVRTPGRGAAGVDEFLPEPR